MYAVQVNNLGSPASENLTLRKKFFCFYNTSNWRHVGFFHNFSGTQDAYFFIFYNRFEIKVSNKSLCLDSINENKENLYYFVEKWEWQHIHEQRQGVNWEYRT
jgi:hypothetical protein